MYNTEAPTQAMSLTDLNNFIGNIDRFDLKRKQNENNNQYAERWDQTKGAINRLKDKADQIREFQSFVSGVMGAQPQQKAQQVDWKPYEGGSPLPVGYHLKDDEKEKLAEQLAAMFDGRVPLGKGKQPTVMS